MARLLTGLAALVIAVLLAYILVAVLAIVAKENGIACLVLPVLVGSTLGLWQGRKNP